MPSSVLASLVALDDIRDVQTAAVTPYFYNVEKDTAAVEVCVAAVLLVTMRPCLVWHSLIAFEPAVVYGEEADDGDNVDDALQPGCAVPLSACKKPREKPRNPNFGSVDLNVTYIV